jgi:RNA polymerase sigma factor for flagellar operon FliA
VNLYPAPSSLMSAPGIQIADPAQAFVDHLPTIERVIGIIARRHGLGSTDADDFASWARTRIIDSDYAVFRKYAGRSSIPTYLGVVLGNLFHDYRNTVWGRWRPSAMALRSGPVAVRLEELLYRDGHTLREAIEVLRSAGVPLSDLEIGQLANRLPARQSMSEVSLEALDGTAAAAVGMARPGVGDDDFAVLRAALAELPSEDRVIMRMRFWDDVSVADIARTLGLEQKPLYRRIDAIEAQLRALLTARGFDRERARDILFREVAW